MSCHQDCMGFCQGFDCRTGPARKEPSAGPGFPAMEGRADCSVKKWSGLNTNEGEHPQTGYSAARGTGARSCYTWMPATCHPTSWYAVKVNACSQARRSLQASGPPIDFGAVEAPRVQ
eukprot:7391796-Prymnesium_polylepis.2